MSSLENFSHNPLYEQFINHLKKKYLDEFNTFTPEIIQDKFDDIFMMGLIQSKNFLKIKRTFNLLYNGHPARQDMINRLGNILFELKKVSPTYPTVLPLTLGQQIKKVIGSDKRYIKKYRAWILTLSDYNLRFNEVNLGYIVSIFPENLIIQKENW